MVEASVRCSTDITRLVLACLHDRMATVGDILSELGYDEQQHFLVHGRLGVSWRDLFVQGHYVTAINWRECPSSYGFDVGMAHAIERIIEGLLEYRDREAPPYLVIASPESYWCVRTMLRVNGYDVSDSSMQERGIPH